MILDLLMNKNIREIIEPEFKHLAIGNVEVRINKKELNNKLVANVAVEPNFIRNPIHKAATEPEQQSQTIGPNENDQLITKGKAVFDKCMKVVMKMGFPQEQGQQLCQLLTETMILADQEQSEQEQQQQSNQQNKPPGTPAGNNQQGPPVSGQIASNNTCAKTASALNKEIEILRAQAEKLDIELNKERQAYQSRIARIAELEKQNHRLGLESYLRKRMDDESMIHYQAMKFASKGFGVEDLKEIYESIPPRTINKTATTVQKQVPKSKVKLRTASTDEYNSNNNNNNNSSNYRLDNIRQTNDKFTNAYLGNSNNLYDDYIA